MMQTSRLHLQGMSCAGCANAIEKAIQEVSGVSECNVNFALSQATVSYNPQKTGMGVQGNVSGKFVQIGTQRWMDDLNVDTQSLNSTRQQWESEAKTTALIAVDGQIEGLIGIADTIKTSSVEAVKALQKMGLEVVMLTGDNQKTAEAIASEVGITRVFAEVRPEQKVSTIKQIQQERPNRKQKGK